MAVDIETIDKLAKLAKLEFKSEEKQEIVEDLERMLAFVNQLKDVDTEGVEPLIYMLEEKGRMRSDETFQNTSQKDALKNAPDKDSDYIKVPKVLKR